jgi:HEAT repeat protein
MGKRASLDDKLAAVRRLRDQDPSPELTAELRKALADRSNLVVAAAASIAGDRRLAELAAPLEAAFPRFMEDPEKTDKLCRAKLAIVQALDKMEHGSDEVFLQAARHVQLEPVWGGSEDSAAPLRAAALLALARIDTYGLLPLLVDSLADPAKDVRLAAAQALGYQGSKTAGLLLRLKVRLGDREPDVISECFSGLLTCDMEENLLIVRASLDSADIPLCEAAMLALGRTKSPQAFEALKTRWESVPPFELRETLLLAIAMLRLPMAVDFLVELVATGQEKESLAALAALKIHAHDPRMRERIAEIVHQRNAPAIQTRFERDFGPGYGP